MTVLFFQLLLHKGMADTKHPGGAPQALPLPVGACNQLRVNVTAFLFAVQYPVAATVLTLVGLSTRTVFTVFDDIDALALLTMTMFDDHNVKKCQIYKSVNHLHYLNYLKPVSLPSFISAALHCLIKLRYSPR